MSEKTKKLSVEDQLRRDEMLYGESFKRTDADGNVERLDPRFITYKQPAKSQDKKPSA